MKKLENKRIAVCIANVSDGSNIKWIRTIFESLKEKRCSMVVFGTSSIIREGETSYVGESSVFRNISFEGFDAIICFSETIQDPKTLGNIVNAAQRDNIPIISIDRYLEGAVNLRMDYTCAFEKLIRHVVEDHGCRRVDYISGHPNNEFSEEREEVYKKVLRDNKIPFEKERIAYGYFWEGPVKEAVEELLKTDIPEAIICANDAMAIETCKQLKLRGIRVPEDVIVTGFDGIQRSKWNDPELTTCELDHETVGNKILELVEDYLDGGHLEKDYKIPYSFRIGGSCGCEKKNYYVSPEVIFGLYYSNKEYVSYQSIMYEMQTLVGTKDSIIQVATIMHSYMVSNGIIAVDKSIKEFSYGSHHPEEDDDEKMRILVKRKGIEIEVGTVFDKRELVPNIENFLSYDKPLIVLPVHSAGNCFGYAVHEIQNTDVFFDKLVIFNYAVGNTLEIFKNQKSLSMANKRLEEVNEKMAEMYVRDPLTKLLNRRGFYTSIPEMMKTCISNGWEMYVASIDMDDLKVINDNYGHSEGDNALKVFGNTMLVNARKYEICSRFGGDEFVVAGIAENAEESGNRYVNSIRNYLNNYNRDSGKPYKIHASIGLSFNKPDEHSVVDEFIIKADRMMYDNKRAFKSRVRSVPGTLLEGRGANTPLS